MLLFYERERSRGRRRLGHDRAFLKPLWRPCRPRRAGAEHASLLRRNRWGSGNDLRRFNFPAIDLHHVSSDRLRGRKILLRRGGYAVRRRLLYRGDVGAVLFADAVV